MKEYISWFSRYIKVCTSIGPKCWLFKIKSQIPFSISHGWKINPRRKLTSPSCVPPVSAGWRQAATGWLRWTTWWSWAASRTPCASSPTSSPSTTTCASLSEHQLSFWDSLFSLPLLHTPHPTWGGSGGPRLAMEHFEKACYAPWWPISEQSAESVHGNAANSDFREHCVCVWVCVLWC